MNNKYRYTLKVNVEIDSKKLGITLKHKNIQIQGRAG